MPDPDPEPSELDQLREYVANCEQRLGEMRDLSRQMEKLRADNEKLRRKTADKSLNEGLKQELTTRLAQREIEVTGLRTQVQALEKRAEEARKLAESRVAQHIRETEVANREQRDAMQAEIRTLRKNADAANETFERQLRRIRHDLETSGRDALERQRQESEQREAALRQANKVADVQRDKEADKMQRKVRTLEQDVAIAERKAVTAEQELVQVRGDLTEEQGRRKEDRSTTEQRHKSEMRQMGARVDALQAELAAATDSKAVLEKAAKQESGKLQARLARSEEQVNEVRAQSRLLEHRLKNTEAEIRGRYEERVAAGELAIKQLAAKSKEATKLEGQVISLERKLAEQSARLESVSTQLANHDGELRRSEDAREAAEKASARSAEETGTLRRKLLHTIKTLGMERKAHKETDAERTAIRRELESVQKAHEESQRQFDEFMRKSSTRQMDEHAVIQYLRDEVDAGKQVAAELQHLKQGLSESELAHHSLTNKLKRVSANFDSEVQSHGKTRAELQQVAAELEHKLSELQQITAHWKREQSRVESLRNQVRNAREETASVSTQLANVRKRADGLSEKLTAEKQVREQNEVQIADLRERLARTTTNLEQGHKQLASVSERLKTLEAERQQSQQQLSEYSSNLSQVQSQYQTLRQTHDRFLAEMRTSKEAYNSHVSTLSASCAEVRAQKEALEDQVKVLAEQVQALTPMQNRVRELRAERGELVRQKSEAESSLFHERSAFQKELDAKSDSLLQAVTELDQLRTDLEVARKAGAKATELFQALQRAEGELDGYAALKQKHQTLVGTHEAVAAQLERSEAAREKLQKTHAQMVANVDALKLEVEVVQTQRAEIGAQKLELRKLTQAMQAHQRQIELHAKYKTHVESQLKDKSTELIGAKQTLVKAESRFAEIERALRDQLVAVSTELDTAVRHGEYLQGKLSALDDNSEQSKALGAMLTEAEKQIAKLESQRSQHVQRVQHLSSEVDSLRANLQAAAAREKQSDQAREEWKVRATQLQKNTESRSSNYEQTLAHLNQRIEDLAEKNLALEKERTAARRTLEELDAERKKLASLSGKLDHSSRVNKEITVKLLEANQKFAVLQKEHRGLREVETRMAEVLDANG